MSASQAVALTPRAVALGAAALALGAAALAALVRRRRPVRKEDLVVTRGGVRIIGDGTVAADELAAFAPVRDWLEAVHSWPDGLAERANVREVRALSVFKPGNRIVFLHAHVRAEMQHRGRLVALPGIVTFRGPSVAALIWCRRDGEVHVLLVRQPRVAVGGYVWEAPAGMLDDKASLSGAMFDEIREETGLVVPPASLREIGTCLASPGLIDERWTLYAAHVPALSEATAWGCLAEGEVIESVCAFPLSSLPLHDAKLRCLLQAASAQGVLGPADQDASQQGRGQLR